MVNSREFKKLLYEHEVLWAKYDIRDHNLNTIVQEVYQNIGQVLSLIRVQLDLLSSHSKVDKAAIALPGDLLSKVIRELRGMCKDFYPEKELLGKPGLLKALEHELKVFGIKKDGNIVEVKGLPVLLSAGKELVIFRMLQEIILYVHKQYKDAKIDVTIFYKKNDVTFIIEYPGEPIECKHFHLQAGDAFSLSRLDLAQRAELLEAKLQVDHNKFNQTAIQLTVPFKTSSYR